ncbi:hypothetical protein BCAR13_1800001 [Paraburkholderia caribensis]|nr:hypothetical protein BCAR13_1800001 [Paraburkholderia caribensis]
MSATLGGVGFFCCLAAVGGLLVFLLAARGGHGWFFWLFQRLRWRPRIAFVLHAPVRLA